MDAQGAREGASRLGEVPSERVERGRPVVRGRFLFHGEEKLHLRGVTYGTFRSGPDGEYPGREVVAGDFAAMARAGVNTVRTYTVPPRWLLDLAQASGLWIMVGLPWEQHVAFLEDRGRAASIEARVRDGVRACARHPAVLCYAVGNEIPSPVVRWHGRERVARHLERLCRAVRDEDPGALVTYVNYPSTEYLDVPSVDLVAFNVYLERPDRFAAYLQRLHTLAGERPLVLAEIGLDSRRNGLEAQAEAIDWQVRGAFASGCAGAFVFAWTDEWHRGGVEVEDWDFGLTDRARRPKPALRTVQAAFADVPPALEAGPSISVVVCSHNGARTLSDCCAGLRALRYPDFEVVVVDDGSTDATADIAREAGFRVISTENRGLSRARNTGMEAARGEIIAYLDDDARPDPDWLTHVARTFSSTSHVAVGGPNLPPPGGGVVADCVANAPGGPAHVLLTDEVAEHVPGCNLAVRKASLQAIGGFDAQFRTAGDDVDVCWRLREQEGTIGFSPGAVVWHHARGSVGAYWRQQRGYGAAEAMLERKWPEKYNAAGHPAWAGRLYGRGLQGLVRAARIYSGSGGSAPFQSLYQPGPSTLASLPCAPEWYLVLGALAGLSALGVLWSPLLAALPLLVLAAVALLVQAVRGAAGARFPGGPGPRGERLGRRVLTTLLFALQPLARLRGRLAHGLTPWRRGFGSPGGAGLPAPAGLGRARGATGWSESWHAPEAWLASVEAALREGRHAPRRGGDFDPWDLECGRGAPLRARLNLVVEEHGEGRQLARVRLRPRAGRLALALAGAFTALALAATLDGAWAAGAVLGLVPLALLARFVGELAAIGERLDAALRMESPPRLREETRPAAGAEPATARTVEDAVLVQDPAA